MARGQDSSPSRSQRIVGRGLHAKVVHALGREIVDGVLATGETLSPDEVGERFGVSRSVVRESLRALESLGMVSARPQVGTRVQSESNWDLLNPQVVLWRGEGKQYLRQMQEILELRLGVEVVAADLAVTRMSRDQIDELDSAVTAMDHAWQAGDDAAFLVADVRFHEVLLRGSGNAVIGQFADTVAAVLHTRASDSGHTIHRHTGQSVDNHRQLAAALVRRDGGDAAAWARRIVESTLGEFEARAESGENGPAKGTSSP